MDEDVRERVARLARGVLAMCGFAVAAVPALASGLTQPLLESSVGQLPTSNASSHSLLVALGLERAMFKTAMASSGISLERLRWTPVRAYTNRGDRLTGFYSGGCVPERIHCTEPFLRADVVLYVRQVQGGGFGAWVWFIDSRPSAAPGLSQVCRLDGPKPNCQRTPDETASFELVRKTRDGHDRWVRILTEDRHAEESERARLAARTPEQVRQEQLAAEKRADESAACNAAAARAYSECMRDANTIMGPSSCSSQRSTFSCR
jgi:hypothetical protein